MKIAYKKRYVNINLVLGILWLIFFFTGIFITDEPHWIDYGWIVISLMYFGLYAYQRQKQYLIIENEVLKVNGAFGKKINLNEIKHIKNFAGDYILQTEKTKLTINTQLIDPNSLADLNAELRKLNVDWN